VLAGSQPQTVHSRSGPVSKSGLNITHFFGIIGDIILQYYINYWGFSFLDGW